MIKIHRESTGILIVLFILLSVIDIIFLLFTGIIIFRIFVILSFLFFLLIILFFRSPARKLNGDLNSITSPADGKVIFIEKSFEKEFFNEEMLKVSIFMSVWDVHLNRVPISGKVIYQKYHAGKNLVAFHEKSSDLNERNTVVIEDNAGRKLLLVQIAGAIARRIKCYVKKDSEVKAGDELGFIKFGSRVDIYFPEGVNLKVRIGDKVYGKKTVIAEF